jgi:hypothetical protein
MIPVSILILLIIFVILYVIGAGLTVCTFIKSIQDKKITLTIISFIIMMFYVVFYLVLV